MAIPTTVAQFGRYRLRTQLAAGNACDVWLAEVGGASQGTPPVVVKKLSAGLGRQPSVAERFIARSLRVQSLEHPNIARVIEVIQDRSDVGVAIEYIDGKSLRQLLSAVAEAGNALPIWFAIHIARCVCHGLEQAHSVENEKDGSFPLLHQGLRPENVFLTYCGDVKITDFGISHRALVEGLDASLSSSNIPAASASSVARGTDLDTEVTDIEGLGSTLYELLTGVCPPAGRVSTVDFVPPSHHASWVNAEVDQILQQVLSPACPERIHTAASLREALAKYLITRHHEVSASHIAGLVTLLFGGERHEAAPQTTRFDEQAVQFAQVHSRRTAPPEAQPHTAFESAAPTRPGIAGVLGASASPPTMPSPDRPSMRWQADRAAECDSASTATDAVPSDTETTSSPFHHDWDLALKRARAQSPFTSRASGTFATTKAAAESPPPPIDPLEQAIIEFEKGLEFRRRGELELALAAWERAISLDPQHRVCHANLSLLKKRLVRR